MVHASFLPLTKIIDDVSKRLTKFTVGENWSQTSLTLRLAISVVVRAAAMSGRSSMVVAPSQVARALASTPFKLMSGGTPQPSV